MGSDKIVHTGDVVERMRTPDELTDRLLMEISRLYRNRLLAHQRQDAITLQLIKHQIADLKAQLDQTD